MAACAGVQLNAGAIGLGRQRPRDGFGCGSRGGRPQAAEQREISTRVIQHRFGPQHKHAQALERGCQQVLAAHQQHRIGVGFEADEAGLHAPLGRAKSRQTRVLRRQEQKVLGQLVVNEVGSVGTGDADDAQVVQWGSARAGDECGIGHAANYDGRHTFCGSGFWCAHGSYGF